MPANTAHKSTTLLIVLVIRIDLYKPKSYYPKTYKIVQFSTSELFSTKKTNLISQVGVLIGIIDLAIDWAMN